MSTISQFVTWPSSIQKMLKIAFFRLGNTCMWRRNKLILMKPMSYLKPASSVLAWQKDSHTPWFWKPVKINWSLHTKMSMAVVIHETMHSFGTSNDVINWRVNAAKQKGHRLVVRCSVRFSFWASDRHVNNYADEASGNNCDWGLTFLGDFPECALWDSCSSSGSSLIFELYSRMTYNS